MEIFTQPINQTKESPESYFDKKSRESYFEMLKVALENLSIVYEKGNQRDFIIHDK